MSFPSNPLDVRLVFAFGASLSAAPTTWTFKDCTADLRTTSDQSVNISVGRSDRSKQPEPNNATFSLNNFAGQYTVDNPAGANYPNVVENVPGIIATARNVNPTFEVDASDWFALNGTVARSTVRAFSGVASLLLTPTGGFPTAEASVSGHIPVRSGGFAYVDAWVYSPAGYGSVAVAVDWIDGGGAYISTTSAPARAVPAGVWTYVGAYIGPAPSNAATMVGKVVESGTPGAGATLWIDEGRTSVPELCGYVDGWTPVFDDSGKLATVNVSVSSSRRRLGRGEAPTHSSVYRAVMSPSSPVPVAYWPLEDGSNAQQANSPIAGVPPATFNYLEVLGSPQFAKVDGPPGSDKLPDFSLQSNFSAHLPNVGTATTWRVQCMAKVNPLPTAGDDVVPLAWFTNNRATLNNVFICKPGGTFFNGFTFQDSNGNTFQSGVGGFDDGGWHEYRAVMTQSGGNIVLNVFVDGVLIINQTYAGTLNNVPDLNGTGTTMTKSDGFSCGHYIIWNTNSGLPDTVDAMNGHPGEAGAARFGRLCGEEGIGFELANVSGRSMAMGPQPVKAFLDLLQEIEDADGGLQLEPFDGFGLGYVVRADLYNLPVALTIDIAQDQLAPPFAPVHDDASRQNDVEVTRSGGTKARYIGDTSRGTYKATPTVNVAGDSLLLNIAAWRVHLGSPRGRLRYPSLSVNFANSAAAPFGPVFSATRGVGIRVQVLNPPAGLPSPDILVSGYTKTLAYKAWKLILLGSPYDPWLVGALNQTLRLETAGQTLAAPLAPGATSLSLATAAGHQLHTTKAAFPNDFPPNNELILNVGGWKIRATDATGAASPQTLIIDPAPNTTTIPAGTSVTQWRAPSLAL